MKHKGVAKKVGSFQSFDGTKIYYETHGQGEPIVLIYGLACLINHWHFQIEHFAQKYQVIAFDIRGHHKSSVPENMSNLTLDAIAKDVSALLRELGIRKAHFFGHSLGVQALLKAYEQFPEHFLSMILVNGFARNPIQGMFGTNIMENLFYFFKSQYQSHPELMAAVWQNLIDNPLAIFGAGAVGGFNMRLAPIRDMEIYARGVSRVPMSVFIALFEDMMAFRGDLVAPTVTTPCLIIGGEKDGVTPPHFQKELHEQIVQSEYLQVPYGSHCTQLDFPEYVNLKIQTFLQDPHPPTSAQTLQRE